MPPPTPRGLAGNYWFRYSGGKFRPTKVAAMGGRIRGARFKPGKYAQIVIAPGDGSGPLRLYEANGDPAVSASWTGRDLLDRDMVHGHTLDIGDIDGDRRGNFKATVLVTGEGCHQGKVADLNGDGRLDILNKPYAWDAPRIDVWLNGAAKPAR